MGIVERVGVGVGVGVGAGTRNGGDDGGGDKRLGASLLCENDAARAKDS